MNSKYFLLLCCLSLVASLTPTPSTQAQLRRFPFTRPSPEEKTPDLNQNAGPWLIMVSSFSGEDGPQQAARLAHELRTKHRLKAYTYTHAFEFDTTSRAMGNTAIELADGQKTIVPSSLTMTSLSPTRFDETAVLVGDFSALDDPHAQRTLAKIKSIEPETLAGVEFSDIAEDDNLAGGRLNAWRMFSAAERDRRRSEFVAAADTDSELNVSLKSAFLLANPMLPEEFFQARTVDKLIIDLNNGREFSLFNNPGTYSVRVATFSGAMIVDQNEISRIKQEEERKLRNREAYNEKELKLVNAEKKAILLTRELRRQGFDAYEFHDRHESYVCVGSFDYLTKEDSQGVKQNNPAIEDMILKFKGKSTQNVGGVVQSQTFPLPRKFVEAGVACDVQPLPVLVPKIEQSKSAGGRFLDRFR
jgi:hypothetical protein